MNDPILVYYYYYCYYYYYYYYYYYCQASETWKISLIQLHLQQSYCTLKLLDFFSRCDLTSYLGLCIHLTITFFSSGLCLDSEGSFTPVLALYDPFGVDVPLNFDITHSLTTIRHRIDWQDDEIVEMGALALPRLTTEPQLRLHCDFVNSNLVVASRWMA